MVSAIEKAALFAPAVASSGVFAMRRAKRGVDAMDENPLFGTANLMIAGGQTFKGVQAAIATTPSASEYIGTMNNALKGVSTGSKLLKPFVAVLKFISANVNPLICGASVFKIFGARKKDEATVEEMFGLGSMFSFEALAKRLVGIPKTHYNAKGIMESVSVEALYKKSALTSKVIKAFEQYCNNTKLFNKIPLQALPGTLKGLFLVVASICGYKLGTKFARFILGNEGVKVPVYQDDKVRRDTNYVVCMHA